MRRRKIFIALLISLASALVGGGLAWSTNEGLSVDLLYLFSKLAGRDKTAERSPDVVIVAIDEVTYLKEPFSSYPQPLWTPYVAEVLDKLLENGVKVVGLDVIYPATGETLVKGYDGPLLRTIYKGAKNGRIVLGKVQNQVHPVAPSESQFIAAGREANTRMLNVFADLDGTIRRMPLAFKEDIDGGADDLVPGMPLELAMRGSGKPVSIDAQGIVSFGGRTFPDPYSGILLDFRPWLRSWPAYSMGDLYDCAKSSNDEFFRRNFAGKIVVVGQILDLEDRKYTSARLATVPEGSYEPERCTPLAKKIEYSGFSRGLIPGSVVIAAGVDNLLRDAALRPSRPLSAAISIWFLTTIATFAAIRRASPRSVALILGGTALAWTLAAVIAFDFGRVIPLVSGWAALAVALGLIFIWRIASGDRARLGLARAFALYLPKSEIDRLLAEETPPALGGEERPVSILFSDIAGFTKLSEHRTPSDLVSDLNAYFGRMTEIVEAHGGFVDKFIGDGLLAVFGAPLRDPDHAAKATGAALDMLAALEAPEHPLLLGPGHPIAIRIGIHSGEAVVGNIGSPKRFNYTVIGDAVNLASRLEGVAKLYGVAAIVSEATHAACGDAIVFRELDMVRVVGRSQPVRLYQPLAPETAARLNLAGFADALEDWRAGRFAVAADKFLKLSAHDPAAASFAARARAFIQAPPPDWQGITDLTSKGA